jgi:hypothetical protein
MPSTNPAPDISAREHPHHPEINVIPFPEIRDRLLKKEKSFDEWELCFDILGLSPTSIELSGGTGEGCTGLLVWGGPWNPGSWEVSERFAKKWQWLVAGCDEVVA